jgi:hypothetical protein
MAIVTIFLILIINPGHTLAAAVGLGHATRRIMNQPEAAPTLIPTVAPYPLAEFVTPEARVLPEVGSNAGLVIGASLLVLIIIGGVLGARLRRKH